MKDIFTEITELIQKIKDENLVQVGFDEEGEWIINSDDIIQAWENYLQNDIEINVEFDIFISGDPMFSRIKTFQTELDFLEFLKAFKCL